ncbi:MAG: hypothetical protein JO369_07990 [Paucibacter sp.]|nr:hypothetical protein [Roseateles sp.]
MNKDVIGPVAWGIGIVALALAGSLARRLGVLDTDAVTRLVIGANGLMIAWMGNRIPKAFVPNARARSARRVAGWSLAVSGLVYAGLFAFAPLRIAYLGGAAAVLAGIALTMGYCLSLRSKAKAA